MSFNLSDFLPFLGYFSSTPPERLPLNKEESGLWGGDREGYEIDEIRVPARTPC